MCLKTVWEASVAQDYQNLHKRFVAKLKCSMLGGQWEKASGTSSQCKKRKATKSPCPAQYKQALTLVLCFTVWLPCCPAELSTMTEEFCIYPVESGSHMWWPSTWNAASGMEELKFLILSNFNEFKFRFKELWVGLVATMSNDAGGPLPSSFALCIFTFAASLSRMDRISSSLESKQSTLSVGSTRKSSSDDWLQWPKVKGVWGHQSWTQNLTFDMEYHFSEHPFSHLLNNKNSLTSWKCMEVCL